MVQYPRSHSNPSQFQPQPRARARNLRYWQKFAQVLGRRPWAILLWIVVAGGVTGFCFWLDPGQEAQAAVAYLERMLYGTAGLLLGALGAGSLALWVDRRDRWIQSVDDALRQFQVPLLGVIPCCSRTYGSAYSLGFRQQRLDSFEMFNPTDVLRGLRRGRSPVGRAYRFLQANLQFLQLRQPGLKVLVVTSAAAKEGKSTIAAGLARALSQRQQRVLLIDANLRHPMQHRIWDLTNGIGFSDVVMEGVPAELALQNVLPDLDLLTAGSSLSHPVAVINACRLSERFQELCSSYDFVILDAPAVDSAVEASVLGQISDGLLWVVRPGRVDRATANKARAFSNWVQLPILGLVVNGATEVTQRPYRIFSGALPSSGFAGHRRWPQTR